MGSPLGPLLANIFLIYPIDPDDFSILTSCSSTFELLLRESLLISKFQPSLNANLRSVPSTLY